MFVYVFNQHGKPLMPCNPPKARVLLKAGMAKVVRRDPFTIKLLHRRAFPLQPSKCSGSSTLHGNMMDKQTTHDDEFDKLMGSGTDAENRADQEIGFGWDPETIGSNVEAGGRDEEGGQPAMEGHRNPG
jgi:hypothetical protein